MLVDKPSGLTSHDVVQGARRSLGTKAIGHTGTLDPFATGLLVLLVGRATRLARYLDGEAKSYLATVRLGFATESDDLTGARIGEIADTAGLTEEAVRAALAGFVGRQQQRPPRYSAKHVSGQRSYQLARRGRGVDPPETTVTVHRLDVLGVATPDVVCRVTVSAGTYIRALARDLGERLGVGGHLAALRREAIGSLRVEDAVPLDLLTRDALRPARTVLRHLAEVELDEPGREAVRHGRALPAEPDLCGDVALVQGGELLAVARADHGWLKPSVVLAGP